MRFNLGIALGFSGAFFTALAASAQTRPIAPSPPARAPVAAPAQSPQPPVSADPQATTATFGDWLLRCQKLEDNGKSTRSCEIVQTLQAGGQGVIAQIAVGRLLTDSTIRLTVLLPTNVSFPSGVKFGVDEKDDRAVDLAWRRCLPMGCLADTELKGDVITRWRSQAGQGRMAFRDGAGQDRALPFSFRGLAQALDAMAKG